MGIFDCTEALRLPVTFEASPTVRYPLPCASKQGRHSRASGSIRGSLQELFNPIFKFPPVRQPNVDGGDFTLAVDEEGGGQRVNPAIKLGRLVIADQHAVVHFLTSGERLHHFPSLIVHGDSQNHQPPLLVLPLKLLKPRDLNFAGTAPGCPEIEQHHFAPVIGEVDDLPVSILQREIGSGVPLGARLYGGNGSRCALRSGMVEKVAQGECRQSYGNAGSQIRFGHGPSPSLFYMSSGNRVMPPNHARRRSRKRPASINASCSRTPEYSHAAVSQKLSQQYSSQKRLRS